LKWLDKQSSRSVVFFVLWKHGLVLKGAIEGNSCRVREK